RCRSRKPHFFFSSRRRHTRWPRDWSSDVCSSDLSRSEQPSPSSRGQLACDRVLDPPAELGDVLVERHVEGVDSALSPVLDGDRRSEERRVGKECRSRWSGCAEIKNE